MSDSLQLGLDTFGDITADEAGVLLPPAQVIRNLVAEAALADEVGVDVFALGEHHRDDFAVSAPEVVLAAAAARTRRIVLGSAVTVLSSDDPIRVFQRFSTLDALAPGRAEIVLGRGSFTESFPLFGHDLADYERLFEEKLAILAQLARTGEVTWKGTVRPPLDRQRVFPPVAGGQLPCWIGVGGSPRSVLRAVQYRMPLMLAIIGGDPARFVPFADLFRRGLDEDGAAMLPVGVHSPGFVAETDEEAREMFWPSYKRMHDRIGAERGWPPLQRSAFEREIAEGSLYLGSPDTVARKIARTVSTLGLARFDLKYSAGPLDHEALLRCIALYGREVIPRVRDLLATA
ncbi:LLM class flavin-dependent oxidoreductase [Rhizosaccharibacter radicis]|uniref:LLM class flavin-dependent oxidoreductase n=1 Tax=Rhizosaccharibacter radicis TaxID=2782605 RepID=A0ABT1VTG8_9PROT|nr:LLM class flavin-dependent oxidoreductase [Acetobacteraceae bacterium KSS12]